MAVVAKSSRGVRFGASLLVLLSTAILASCASSDETFGDGVATPQPDAHKDVNQEAQDLCASNCPQPSTQGMVACCTTDNKCGEKPEGGDTCIANVPDSGAAGSGGMGGMGP